MITIENFENGKKYISNENSFKQNTNILKTSKYKKNGWTTNQEKDCTNYSDRVEVKADKENLFEREFKSVKILNVENESFISFQEAIYPVMALAQFFALMPVSGISSKNTRDLKFEFTSLKFAYFFLYFTAISLMSAITTAWMVVNHMEFGVNGPLIFYSTNLIGLVCTLRIAKNWPKLMVQWEYTEKEFHSFKNKFESKSLSVKIKLITFILMLVALFEHSLAIASGVYKGYSCIYYEDPAVWYFTRSYASVWQFINYSLPISILIQVIHLYLTFTWNFTDLFIIIISVGLSTRLKQINDNMKIFKYKVVPEIFWEIHRNYYQSFCDLLESVDKAFSWLILLSFSCNLHAICMQILHIVNPTPNLVYGIYFWFSLTFLITRTTVVGLCAANIYEESRKPIDILQSVPNKCYNVEVKRFFHQIINSKIALTGNKLFYITRHLILKIAGTVITYELVLIQFNTEEVPELREDCI